MFPPLSLGGFPTLYTVEVKERLEDWTDETVMRTNTTDLSLVLTDLEPLTRYDARVRSRNFNGFSEFSQERQFSTFSNSKSLFHPVWVSSECLLTLCVLLKLLYTYCVYYTALSLLLSLCHTLSSSLFPSPPSLPLSLPPSLPPSLTHSLTTISSA